MRRRSQRTGTPAQCVLRLLNDVLEPSVPEFASQILGFPEKEHQPDSALLPSLFSTFSFAKFSRIQPKLYCDSLHSLYQASQHAFFKKELQSKISEGQTFCQDFFRSLIAANDLSALIQQGISELDYLSFRANIYGVLANALEVVGLRLDGHRNVLYEVFRSFFSELRQTPMRNDFHVADQLIKRTNLTETELDECNRLFFHMRAFVKLSVVKHWSNYATVGRHSLGFVSGLVAIAIETAGNTMQIQDCEKMDQSLCLMARDILKKLHEQNRTTAFASLMEEILRDMDIVPKCLKMVSLVDKRMQETLRTNVIGVFRDIFLLTLSFPESSLFRNQIVNQLQRTAEEIASILCNNLITTPESGDLQIVLFEIMSLYFEIRNMSLNASKVDAFVDTVNMTLPSLVRRLNQPQPSEKDILFVNAQLVFLSKITSPSEQGQTSRLKRLIVKALEIVKTSKFFGILLKTWPPEDEIEIARVRSIQHTICLGLNFVMNILHRDRLDGSVQDSIVQLFVQHFEEFQNALKMGSHRAIIFDRQWTPLPTDEETAKLIQLMIQNSKIHKKADLMARISPFLSPTHNPL